MAARVATRARKVYAREAKKTFATTLTVVPDTHRETQRQWVSGSLPWLLPTCSHMGMHGRTCVAPFYAAALMDGADL